MSDISAKKMSKKAIIIYGPPGAGKNTQAELLSGKFGLIHFQTGPYIERLVHSEKVEKSPILKREQELFDTGKLATPSWVLTIVKKATKMIAKSGFGVIYSSSPRTIFEAFGDEKNGGLISFLEKTFGRENIHIIRINISGNVSIERNSRRLICSVCGLPILVANSKKCPFCFGPPRKRTLDDPKIIKTRLLEYKNRTYPIIEKLKERGYRIISVSGAPPPYKVFKAICLTSEKFQ